MTELRDLTHILCVPEQQARRNTTQRKALRAYLPELVQLERILAEAPEYFSATVEGMARVGDLELPLYRVDIGQADADRPALLIVGGVHGLERIGTQVVTAWMQTLANRLRWDSNLARLLEQVRIVVMPILNPGGMFLNQRCNPSGVDLMRNAPISAQDPSTFLLGGQRLSPRLPWYMGKADQEMEPENLALKGVIDEVITGRPFCLSLDCHSGFGWQDQIWFPYAYRRRPMRRLESVFALKLLWEKVYPDHNYVMEPQSNHYLTHGDLWDYFYKRHNRQGEGTFIPLTLELGSWRWIRKRPRQLLKLEGLFNPLVPHRLQRVLRSHLLFLNFLLDATAHYNNWLPADDQTQALRTAALLHWYPDQS
ncbi:M14 family zinc carboxypeptidase [Marinobacter salicampi]|uniref:M14 family zinc carboxypeptidase n=1 Tax=Marinobacter salicampi TaxID=435907 RepID=UPI001409E0CD|nr:M14 family zinc carboxypeptidase [Marinobacter salicampi]